MPLQVKDLGHDNRVEIAAEALAKVSGAITLHGSRNVIRVAAPLTGLHGAIDVYNDTRITIGPRFNGMQLRIHAADGAVVTIGAQVGFNGRVRLLLHEAARIAIGDHCLFGSEVDVMVSDMHSIIDAASGERINPAKDVVIGDRVWIGQRAMVLKGVTIGAGSIVGAGSTVTGDVAANCLAVGYPAKVIKQGVTWKAKLI